MLSECKYKYQNFNGEIVEKNVAEVVNTIKETILKHVSAKYIYLFGSYAYGDPKDSSDIDIYFITPDNSVDHVELYSNIIIDLSDEDIYSIDLFSVDETEFNTRKNEYSFEKSVYEKGILIYDEQRDKRIAKAR